MNKLLVPPRRPLVPFRHPPPQGGSLRPRGRSVPFGPFPYPQLAQPFLELHTDAVKRLERPARGVPGARRFGKRPRRPVPPADAREILSARGHLLATLG